MAGTNPPEIPTSLIEDLRRTLDLEAQQIKHADLTHRMTARAHKGRASYEQQSARAVDAAAKLREIVASSKAEWGRGYNNDWISSTYAMLAICNQLAEYIEACNVAGAALGTIDSFLGRQLGLEEKGYPKDTGASELLYGAFDAYTYEDPPKKALPKLQYHAEFKDGKLKVDSLKDMRRANGKPLFPTLDDQNEDIQRGIDTLRRDLEARLQAGVIVWLDSRGYKPEEKLTEDGSRVYTGVYLDKDAPGDPSRNLTEEKFNELKISAGQPELSFDAFLKGQFGVDFQHVASPGR